MGWGGQGGCEGRIEVNVKIENLKKKYFFFFWGGGGGLDGGGVRVDVNEQLKFFVKIQKKKILGGGVWSEWGWGVQVDVNGELNFFVKIKMNNFFFSWGGGVWLVEWVG